MILKGGTNQNEVWHLMHVTFFAFRDFAITIMQQSRPGQKRRCGCEVTRSLNTNSSYLVRKSLRSDKTFRIKSSGHNRAHPLAIQPILENLASVSTSMKAEVQEQSTYERNQ